MENPSPTPQQTKPRVVVVGGGFGGLEAAYYLRMRLGHRVDLTLVSDRDQFLFKPNTIYIPFGKKTVEDLLVPIAEPARKKGITFVQAHVSDVNSEARVVVTDDGRELPYDHLILATGASMRPEEVPGLGEHANTIFSPDEMLRLRDSFSRLVEKAGNGEEQKVLFLVPPNNKCSGPLYEMVMMLDTWLRDKGVRDAVDITYASFEASYIMAFGPRLHDVVTEEFDQREITGHLGKRVARVEKDAVHFEGGEALPFDLLVSFPPYVASTPFKSLPSDERGFIATDLLTREVPGHENVYVVGDAGDFPVKQAFLAFLQADAAAERVSARILGEEPRFTFDPVSMCIMEQFDKATFAQVPLTVTGDPARPVIVRDANGDDYRVGSGELWRVGKKMLGAAIPYRFRHGQPFHAGATWKTMEAGLDVMRGLFTT